MKKLNIGCGHDKRPGYINLDIAQEVKPDIVHDISDGLPFADNTFDIIYSSHCIEHVTPDRWSYVLDEIMRVAKPDCILELMLPFDNIKKRTNIGHYRTFGWWSFTQYYADEKIRGYYRPWKLQQLHREATIIEKIFFLTFPILKKEIYFKFRVIK